MDYPYRRETLYADSDVEVVRVTWPPRTHSFAHDHGNSSGLIRVLSGSVYHDVFDKGTLTPRGRSVFQAGECFLETPDISTSWGMTATKRR